MAANDVLVLLVVKGCRALPCPVELSREVMYEEGPEGTRATGLRLSKAGEEKVVQADAYIAALDVPGAKRLIPTVRWLKNAGVAACCY